MARPPDAAPEQHLSLELQGLVQGVGFRPHVVRLALLHGLRGTVANSSRGVQLDLEGARPALEAFRHSLLANPPDRARIDHEICRWQPVQAGQSDAARRPAGVRILEPLAGGNGTTPVSPDLAICPRCLEELRDPTNRRHGYPFISCADCGPRYSVVEQLPFEREHTSFRHFPLCEQCGSEFSDPADRRFHAQTISCPACGPQLRWDGQAITNTAGIQAAATALAEGAIVALQGVGGFQLLVDPANAEALQRLRQRKGRPHKPLALLASSDWMESHCCSHAGERELCHGPTAPILLLRRPPDRQAGIAAEVAGRSPWLGVMRASSGLQQLLLEACGGVVVATSANRSGEPLCANADADAATLRELADHVLSHTLPVVNRIDDSVQRWAAGGALTLRLGRGLAPVALPHPSHNAGALGLGAQIKGALALQTESHLLLSPDLGDLSSVMGAAHHQHTCRTWLQRHGLSVRHLACDQHPGYSASAWAAELAARHQRPLHAVQHHHAHLLAVMAEHRIEGQAVGVAWDGAGQGDDGTLWGGEALAINHDGYRRIAHLRPWPLPGGERAQREPRRAALGLLLEAYGPGWRDRLASLPNLSWRTAFSDDDLQVLEQSVWRGLNAPRSSSIGRLFDAVAALLGLAQCCSYEAQAAMALEALALEAFERPSDRDEACPLDLPLQRRDAHGPWQWNWQPLLTQLLEALARDTPAPRLALAFHQALAQAIAALARAEGCQELLLAGGCFQNALLLELSINALNQQGCRALWPQQLPCNDAALPIGQLLAAESVSINRVAPRAESHVPGRRR
ncbi:carbamoyltransferase HypF [Vulcanococcus sp. Clear-D1]|uniref:carbamoyltransferase HypF n=1 Tax=Vulcanococcus sp. Clear-D1 TaxID=2766970 RepID=UPI0019AA4068|nr:carbamoyltransferase HypF [Vulcanococcus sp. Clear-D1]MBD1195216.1 carbamoyltransferase HypF [Vulcanococcus sp. Clear-D1]